MPEQLNLRMKLIAELETNFARDQIAFANAMSPFDGVSPFKSTTTTEMKEPMMINKRKLASYAAATVAATTQPAWAQREIGTWGSHMGEAWHGWFMGPVAWPLFLVIAIALTVFIVRAFTQKGSSLGNDPPDLRTNPLDILKERFAKGEIEKKEFDERRRHLGL